MLPTFRPICFSSLTTTIPLLRREVSPKPSSKPYSSHPTPTRSTKPGWAARIRTHTSPHLPTPPSSPSKVHPSHTHPSRPSKVHPTHTHTHTHTHTPPSSPSKVHPSFQSLQARAPLLQSLLPDCLASTVLPTILPAPKRPGASRAQGQGVLYTLRS